MNIYQLNEQYLNILNMADDLDPEVLKDTLSSIEEPIQDKLSNIIGLVRSLENEVEMIQKEEKRLKQRKESRNNTIKNLKEVLFYTVSNVGETTDSGGKRVKIKDNPYLSSVYTQKNPPSVKILDESKIPDEYRIKQPDKIDSKLLIQDWKFTNELPEGVEIVQGEGVRFR